MRSKRRTPAIFAGLVGGAVWSVPVLAGAASLDLGFVNVTMDDLLASPVAYFAVGVLGGAALTGAVVGGVSHHRTRRLRLELERARAERDEAACCVIRVSTTGTVLDVGGAAALVGAEAAAGSGSEAGEELADTADLGRSKAPAEQDAPAEAQRVAPEAAQAIPPTGVDLTSLALEMAAPARVSARIDRLLPRMEDPAGVWTARMGAEGQVAEAKLPHEAQEARTGGGSEASEVGEGSTRPQAPAGERVGAGTDEGQAGGRHATLDYEQVAENYVRNRRYKERRNRRSRGVRAVLADRLGGNIMEGLPVIERADGSTTDIGTGWWDKNVGSTHSFTPVDNSAVMGMQPVDKAADPLSTADLRAAELARARRDAQAAGFLGTSEADDDDLADTAHLDSTARSQAIARRLPVFDESLYPDERPSEPAGEDLFEQAMRAMDEELPSDTRVTTSADLSQAPAPLSPELETGAVVSSGSLGVQAARDGVDIEAHVDSLVRDEMEHRHAGGRQHAGQGDHPHLTVFEGTGDLSASRAGHAARHLAPSKRDREA